MSHRFSRLLSARASAAAALFVATLTPALAADHPLDAVPEDVSVVMRVRKPKTSVENALKVAASVDQKFGVSMRQSTAGIGAALSNPALVSVDQKLDWYILYVAKPPGPAEMVFAMPAVKIDAMEAAVKQAMGQGTKIARHDNWLFYSLSEPAINRVLDCKKGNVKSVKGLMDSQSQAVMDQHDISYFINAKKLTQETYKIEMEAARIELEEAMKNPTSLVQPPDGVDIKPIAESYIKLLQGFHQMASETEWVTIGLSVKAKGVDLDVFAKAPAGSTTSRVLGEVAPAPMAILEKLPPGRLFYSAMHGNYSTSSKWGLSMVRSFTKDDNASKELDAALQLLDEVQVGTTATAFTIGDVQNGVLRSITVSEVKPPEKARELTRKTVSAMSRLNFAQGVQTAELKEDAETIGDLKLDLLEVKPAEGAGGGGFQGELIKSVYGEDGSTTRIAYLTDMVVQSVGGGQESMEEALTSLGILKPKTSSGTTSSTAGPKPNPALIATRTQLSPSANAMILIDLPGFVSEGLKLAINAVPNLIPTTPETLKKLSLKRSYVGISLATEPSGVRVKAHLPVTQMQGVQKMWGIVSPFMQNLLPRGGQPGMPGAIPGMPGAALQVMSFVETLSSLERPQSDVSE